MRKFFCIALSALLGLSLAGCAPATPPADTVAPAPATPAPAQYGVDFELPEVEPFLTLEEYPAMDGSTANLPLMAAVMACATGIPLEEAQLRTQCSTTPGAYSALLRGQADILLVYEGAESTQREIEDSGVALTLTPIGRDALVFIGNESNPVTDLSQRQLRAIYTGKTKNWRKVGGADLPIEAFQRTESSGSQALFMKLLMQDEAPMKAPSEMISASMGMLIEHVSEYNGEGGAIGYSVYYYANYMYAQPGLKFFSVDGVAPTDATIASGEYPLLNEFYLVLREDAPAGSPARRLADWLLGDEGRSVIAAAGYIPAF